MEQLFAQAIHIPGLPQVSANASTLQIVLSIVFLVAGGVATLYILIGAIRYAISQGDQSQISGAKNTILYALIGLVVSLSAFAIVQFVLGQLGAL